MTPASFLNSKVPEDTLFCPFNRLDILQHYIGGFKTVLG